MGNRAMPWAIAMAEYVNAHSDINVTLWSANFGHPLGTVAYSAIVESQVALADGTAKLLVDDGYFELLEQGQARVSARIGDKACAETLLTAERKARSAGRGLWADPNFAPLRAENLPRLQAETGHFALVEGKLLTRAREIYSK